MKKGHRIISIAIILIAITWIFWGVIVFSGSKNVTGHASSVATVGLVVLGNCNQEVNLSSGWNFISLYAIPSNYTIESVLSSIDGYYDYLQEWDSDNQQFKVWSKYGLKQFTEFNQNKSYFVRLTGSNPLDVNGGCFENLTINLSAGWETPAYIYDYPANVSGNQFKNVTFEYMQKWNASNQEFLAYSPIATSNPFNEILVSEGYFILTQGGQLVYVKGS